MWACLQQSSWCNHQDPCGGPGKEKIQATYPLPTPPPPHYWYFKKAFPVTPSLSAPLSSPSSDPRTPRSSPADFLPIARRGDGLGWEEGRGRWQPEGVDLPPLALLKTSAKELSLESHPRGNRTLSGRHREDPEPAASARAKAKHTRAGPTLGRRSAIGEAIDSQRWGSKDSICLPPTSHPRPGAAEPGCQSQSQAPGLGTAHSFRRVSRQRNFHVFPKSEKVGDGTVGDSHLGNTGSSESSCDCSLRSFVSISKLHCLLGYRRTQIPPLSALEDELQLQGGWEEGEEVGPGAGPDPGAGLPCLPPGLWVSPGSLWPASPLFPAAPWGECELLQKTVSRCTC